MKTAEPIEILLIEDNPGDERLTREAFREGRIAHKLNVVHDGVEALDFLFQRGDFADAREPSLILLDLNLPRMNGRQVLGEIKKHERLRCIPVVVLTTSSRQRDIAECYALQANCYITKPLDLERFMTVIRKIEDFWLSVERLPNQE